MSSLCQRHAYLLRIKKNDSNHASRLCAGAVQILQTSNYLLELRVSSLCKNHADLLCIPSVAKELDCPARLLREIRTFGRAIEASNVFGVASWGEGAGVTHQEQLQLLHSSVPGPVPDSWPLFLPFLIPALPSS